MLRSCRGNSRTCSACAEREEVCGPSPHSIPNRVEHRRMGVGQGCESVRGLRWARATMRGTAVRGAAAPSPPALPTCVSTSLTASRAGLRRESTSISCASHTSSCSLQGGGGRGQPASARLFCRQGLAASGREEGGRRAACLGFAPSSSHSKVKEGQRQQGQQLTIGAALRLSAETYTPFWFLPFLPCNISILKKNVYSASRQRCGPPQHQGCAAAQQAQAVQAALTHARP